MADGYERWDAPTSTAPAAQQAQDNDGYEKFSPVPVQPQGVSVADVAKVGAAGAGMGAAAWLTRGVLRRMFPGMRPTTSALKRIDQAIREADDKSGLKNEFSQYMRMVGNSDVPLTFADFLAQRPGMKGAVSVVKDMVGHSGNVPFIENMLGDRVGNAQKKRILDSISTAMGVNPQGISAGIEELKKNRGAAAQPLYDLAFKDKRPIADTRLLELFGENTPNMAMMNALKSRLKTLALSGKEPPSLYAADPARRDAWKRLMTTEVPEHMFAGEEWNKLRPFYAPAIEDLHGMRMNLWDHYSTAKRAGNTEDAKAYLDSWKKLTDYMDMNTSGAYKAARQKYKGDSDMMNAFESGSELLKKKPDEVRAIVAKMGPAEREALSAGFYGGLENMDTQRFIREFVARPERYPERQEILSAVFRDPKKLRDFLDSMTGEQALQASAASYGDLPMPRDPGPRMPYARASDAVSFAANPKVTIGESLSGILGWPSRRASKAGTGILFREPHELPAPGGGQNWAHADWDTVRNATLSGLEQAREAGLWTGVGGAGGLGLYGGYEALSGQPPAPPFLRPQP